MPFLTLIFMLRPSVNYNCRNLNSCLVLQPVVEVCLLPAMMHAVKIVYWTTFFRFKVIDSSPDQIEREGADRVHKPDLAKRRDDWISSPS